MENQSFYGSIDFTALLDAAKAGHPAFTRHENGKIYASVSPWLNSEPDKYGNTLSIALNPPKDSEAKKVYFGNFKKGAAVNRELTQADTGVLPDADDLPF